MLLYYLQTTNLSIDEKTVLKPVFNSKAVFNDLFKREEFEKNVILGRLFGLVYALTSFVNRNDNGAYEALLTVELFGGFSRLTKDCENNARGALWRFEWYQLQEKLKDANAEYHIRLGFAQGSSDARWKHAAFIDGKGASCQT